MLVMQKRSQKKINQILNKKIRSVDWITLCVRVVDESGMTFLCSIIFMF